MSITNEEKDKYLDVLKICLPYGRSLDTAERIVNGAYRDQKTKEFIQDGLRNYLGRDCFKQIENAAGTPEIRSDVSLLKEQNDRQGDIFNAFRQNSELQMNNLINEVEKLTSQVIEYKTELDDTRERLHKALEKLDNIYDSGLFNCAVIGKTLPSEADLDGLSEIIV